MSSIPEPSSDPAEVRARDDAATALLVTEFLACRESRAAIDAREIRTLAAAAALTDEQRSRLNSRESLKTDLPTRTMVAELAVAARVSERTIQRQLGDAADLCKRFAHLVDALGSAAISRAHVAVIHEAGFAIDDAAIRDDYVSAAIALAETMTPGRLRPIVELLAARLHPRTIEERYAEACEARAVRVIDGANGMADITATIPAVLAHGIHDRLTQHARVVIDGRPDGAGTDGARTDGGARDDRTMDQLRADVLCDLLLTGTAETCTEGEGIDAIRATVQITVPVLTAARMGTEPALLAGYGPIDPDSARHLAGNVAGWERVMTSPVTGCVLAVDRYRPSKAMKRMLRARDERCRFPGCRQPVWRCDLDHTIDAAQGGPTECGNLAHQCKRHHILKHNSRWRVRHREPGVLEWTSPTGRVYLDLPEPTVRFSPAVEHPEWSDPAQWARYDPRVDPSPF